MNDYVEIPHYSLSPRVLTLYSTLENGYMSERQRKTFENLEDNKNQYNELSQHSVKRLRRSINFMIYISNEKEITGRQIISKNQEFTTEYEKSEKHSKPVKHKLSMITLTLPAKQNHTDEEIKKVCLGQFLIELSAKHRVKTYIWKAEKQENNNIHFHILINQYIHYEKIRNSWNRIIEKLDYVSTYQRNQAGFYANGFKVSSNKNDKRTEAAQKKAYNIGISQNWKNPNSTDIHSLYKVRNAGAYLTKYLAKGVTKTERTSKIKNLRDENDEIKKTIDEMQKEICFFSNADPEAKSLQVEINSLEQNLSNNSNALCELLKSGVSGRIWGQSQSLSKLKPLTVVENWSDVPEIDEVIKKAEFTIENTIGTRKIHSYIFDVQNFPLLKANLDFHLKTLQKENHSDFKEHLNTS